MIKKHRILWAEALCVVVVCVLHPRILGWINLYVLYLALVFLVISAMHEERIEGVNNKFSRSVLVFTLLTLSLVYLVPFFPWLYIIPFRGDWVHLFEFIAVTSGSLAVFGWITLIVGAFDDETNKK